MFEFAWWWLIAAWPLPLIYRSLRSSATQHRSALRLPGANRLLGERGATGNKASIRWLVPLLIWSLAVVAAMRPQWLGEPITVDEPKRDILIAMDLSGSMEMDDMSLNGRPATRLQIAHSILADFIERRQGDRIGLIVYADGAYIYAPITRDLTTVAELVRDAQLGLAGQRTALGDAIGLGIKYFNENSAEQRIMLMLTDGMINAGVIGPEEAIDLARSHDVRIHTIGIGSDEYVVDGIFGQRRINPSADLDENFLNQVASVSGGEYFRARNAVEMERVYELIDQLEPISSDEEELRPATELFHWPLAIAWLALLLQLLLPGVMARWKSLQQAKGVSDE